MTPMLATENLTVRYRDTVAVDRLSIKLNEPGIIGLLGRNGSGKSSLLAALAGLRRTSEGEVTFNGQPVFENEAATTQICLIRESGDTVEESERIETALKFAGELRPYWDETYARKLLELFKLDPRRRINTLSRGQRSALGCTLGLAARAPITLFDEVYLGLDAPSRYAFYEALLADYMDYPRLIVLSTHLIEEVARLFSEVIILHEGRMVLRDEAEALQRRGASLVGPEAAVERALAGMMVLSRRSLGPTTSVAVYGDTDELGRRAASEGIEMGTLPLQDLFVHLTAGGNQS
jgi:ABC-2 type transport system ATP-binding protein